LKRLRRSRFRTPTPVLYVNDHNVCRMLISTFGLYLISISPVASNLAQILFSDRVKLCPPCPNGESQREGSYDAIGRVSDDMPEEGVQEERHGIHQVHDRERKRRLVGAECISKPLDRGWIEIRTLGCRSRGCRRLGNGDGKCPEEEQESARGVRHQSTSSVCKKTRRECGDHDDGITVPPRRQPAKSRHPMAGLYRHGDRQRGLVTV
jgi:hypothetical protein